MAWTRTCGSDAEWWVSGINACDVWPVGTSAPTTLTAETISRGNDGGNGSAVRLTCFFKIFRVASLLA